MSDATARAALLLAVGLGALGAPPRAGAPPVCDTPRLQGGAGSRLPTVSCDRPEGAAPGGALPLLFGGRIDLNRAPARALEALPAIGPARAAAIARARVERPFCSVDELERVRGIGPATAARVAPLAAASCAEE